MKPEISKYFSTLEINDFLKCVENFKYITNETVYTEEGVEMKLTTIKKKSTKWQELIKKWRRK